MKIDKIVYCKKNYRYTGITPNVIFKFGESYEITDLLYDNTIIRINNVLFNYDTTHKNNRNYDYYFESEKEHRARKLRILNINK